MQYKQGWLTWLPLLIGLLLGLASGLSYAWFIDPVQFINIAPSQLTPEDKTEFLTLVSESYLAEGDLALAQARLSWADLRQPGESLARLADEAFNAGGDPREIRALTALALALGSEPEAAELFAATPAPVLAAASRPTPTFELMPSPTPSLEPSPAITQPPPPPTPTVLLAAEGTLYELVALNRRCESDEPPGVLQVFVTDSSGNGIPAVEVQVQWEAGQDRFFTGLKLEVDPGYGDFQMEENTRYSVLLPGLSEPVLGIDSALCLTAGGQFTTPSYLLVFAPDSGE